jgi:atlastin
MIEFNEGFYSQYKSIRHPNNPINDCNCWMGNIDEPLKGFSWRSGTTRDTTGIIFWSDVFLYDNPNGQKLAILVMDTQGLFDNVTSTADNSKIFSLSSLLASVQILNLHGLVQEDHLQYLQFATEYAQFTANKSNQNYKPFQSFMFLIRDWNNPDEFPFGVDGGQKYLDGLLVVKPEQPEVLKSVRNHIRLSFEKLSCCLLPYPGKSVARDSTYDGRWGLMDEEFLNELKAVIPKLLKPENLVTKKINNIEMNADMVNDYFQQYITLYKTGSSIQPQSIFETTIDKFMMEVVARSYQAYKNHANSTISSIGDENGIANVYSSSKGAGFAAYDAEKKMGTSEHVTKYRNILDQKMETDSIEWKAVALAGILRVREERRRAEVAAQEAERARLARIEQERIARERAAQLQREAEARAAEAARQAELLRQQQLAIQAEQERQRLAEEQRQRELAEQQRIEAERAAEAERARQQQQHHRRRKKCSVM